MLTDKDFTHVISGYSSAFSIANVFKLPTLSVVKCGDILSIGKQNLSDDYSVWANARKAALAEAWGLKPDELSDTGERFELFHNYDSIAEGKPVLLWLDCNLNSHLMAAFICYLFRANGWDLSRLHSVSYERVEREIYKGMLTVLNDEELRSRRPENKKLSSADFNSYADIWTTLAGQSLADIISVCASGEASKLTMDTLRYFTRRFPSRFNGLNEIEQDLLKHTIDCAPDAAKAVGFAMGYDETPDMLGDLYLIARLRRFGAADLKHPLIEIDNPSGSVREFQVRVLPLAHQILSGASNMIELNGLDDWIGGAHLAPDNVIYREDAGFGGQGWP